MTLKDILLKRGMALATHPAVSPLLQDERVMKAFMTALALPGRVAEITEEQKKAFAKMMGLATARDVQDLRRTIRSLEEDVERLRRDASTRE